METIGREKEIQSIKSALRRKANVLLVGRRGVGKSHLLQYIAEEMEVDCYYIPYLYPAKGALIQAISNIMTLSMDELKAMKISRMTVPILAEMLIEVIKEKGSFVLIIDALDKITAANSEWLKQMAEEITLLGAIVEPKSSEHLKRFFWTFETVAINPLPDADIKQLVLLSITQHNIQFADERARKLFLNKVPSISKGLPLAALQLCRKAANHTRKVSVTFIREHLQEHSASVKFIDATYLFISLFGLIIAMRYISRGMGSTDAYVFWGAMSGIMLIFRWLMFRSMRKRG